MSDPTFAEVLGAYISAALDDVNVGVPGVVLAYDAATQRARVQPAVRRDVSQDGAVVSEQRPILASVPVVFAGGGGARTTYPVAAGDSVLLLVASTPIDRWLATGGSDVAEGAGRRHDLSNAIAVIGLRDARRAWSSAPTDCVSVGYDTGATVEIHDSEVRLGGSDATGSAAALPLRSTVETLVGVLSDAGVKAGIAAASIDGGTSYQIAITAYFALHPLQYTTVARAK